MIATQSVYQSRFGFHPCDKETFDMLKFLNKHCHIAQRQLADWKRWNRKLPHNRVIREYLRHEDGRKYGSRIIGPRPEPQVCPFFLLETRYQGKIINTAVMKDYQNARTPRVESQVKPLTSSKEMIKEVYDNVKNWFGN